MDWLYSLFVEHSALQAVVVLSLISAIGLGLGKIHVCGISLGVTFVFFAGIIAGHFGLSIDPQMLNYAESFGLVIFVYALGLQVGPGFFSSFRKGGVQLNMLATGVVLIGTLLTVLGSYGLGVSLPDMVGILCGATTNTPALGAAQQTLKQMGLESSTPALGCAVAYPLGVVGVILAVLFIRKTLAHKEDLELKEKDDVNKPYIVAFQVHNPAIFNKSIKEIGGLNSYPKFVISRLWRDGNVSIPTSEKIIKEGDRLLVITSEKNTPALTVLFGEQEHTDWNKEDIDWNAIDSQLISQRIVVTRPELNGKKLGSLHLRNHYGINISRVYRSGVQLLATAELTLQLGDRLTVVGEAAAIQNVGEGAGQCCEKPEGTELGGGIYRHCHRSGFGSNSYFHSRHQRSRAARIGRRPYHRRYSYRDIRSEDAHGDLYYAQCEPDAPCIGIVSLPGLPGTGCRCPFLRYGIPAGRAVMDCYGFCVDCGSGIDYGYRYLQVAEDRFRNNGGYAVRKHGKPHGAELRQRHHSGRQSVCSLCYGLSAVHVSTGNYSPSAAHVLH